MGQGALPGPYRKSLAEELEVNLNQVNIAFCAGRPEKIWQPEYRRQFHRAWFVQEFVEAKCNRTVTC
jgi:hypothetical protein